MGKVLSISNRHIQAAASSDGIPTLWLRGIVGEEIPGLDLAAIAEMYGEVRLLLDTVGGDAADAFAFYDAVRVRGIKVHVEGYGRVASAGTIIMAAAGLKRSSLAPNAEYLIHEAYGGDPEAVERYNERMANVYSELSGMSTEEVRKIMKADKMMSAQEAKKLKLVGTVLQHEAVAAQIKAMEEIKETIAEEVVETAPEVTPEVVEDSTVEVEQEIPVTVPEAISAAMRGFITAKVKVAKEMSDAVASLTDEVKAKTAELDEVKAEAESLREQLTAAEAKAKDSEEVTAKLAAITAELETLKATPAAKEVVKAEAKEVQVPGGGPGAKETKMTKQQKREAEMIEAFDRVKKTKRA